MVIAVIIGGVILLYFIVLLIKPNRSWDIVRHLKASAQFKMGVKIAGILAIIPLMLYSPPFSIYDQYILGPKIDIKFYDKIEYVEGFPTIVVDVENIGGVTLHNLYAYLDYSCGDTTFVNQKVSGRFEEGPFEMKKGDIRPFYFRNENILNYHEENKLCYDAIQDYYILDDNRHVIENYRYLFNDEENTVKCYNITGKVDLDYTSVCEYCKVNINISSDEKDKLDEIVFPYVSWQISDMFIYDSEDKKTIPKEWFGPSKEVQLVFIDAGNPMCQDYTETSGKNTCAGYVQKRIYDLHYSKYNFSTCVN